jgi:hypothetical protein
MPFDRLLSYSLKNQALKIHMISSKVWQSISVSAIICLGSILSLSHQVLANVELSEDKLNTEKSLRWGGEGLPFNELVTIRDALVNSVVGKVVIDRHGEDNGTSESTGMLSGLFNALTVRAPFAGPNPGRLTIVTLWGSKEEGCFVKALIHNAPKGGGGDRSQSSVPVKMEIGIGDRAIKLSPVAKSVPKMASGSYTYTENKIERTAQFYFAENTFAINAKVADLLRNAPAGDARVRLTFGNGDTKVFAIGAKNIAQFRDSYGYNPSCTARN